VPPAGGVGLSSRAGEHVQPGNGSGSSGTSDSERPMGFHANPGCPADPNTVSQGDRVYICPLRHRMARGFSCPAMESDLRGAFSYFRTNGAAHNPSQLP